MYTHIWFFFSVIPGTGNVPKETRRSNMIGKQPPLQRFASMQDYLPDLDYAVHTMVCLTAANFCRRLPLFNLTYRRTISIRRNEEFLFLRPCPFTRSSLPFTGRNPPRTKASVPSAIYPDFGRVGKNTWRESERRTVETETRLRLASPPPR